MSADTATLFLPGYIVLGLVIALVGALRARHGL